MTNIKTKISDKFSDISSYTFLFHFYIDSMSNQIIPFFDNTHNHYSFNINIKISNSFTELTSTTLPFEFFIDSISDQIVFPFFDIVQKHY